MTYILTIVFAILMFSFLVFIHEMGHFVAAKLSGVQVNEFAMFMGPAIVKWKRGETQYSIRCIPFGGYCAMEGEDEDTENPRSFQKASWWKRLIILIAGSAMNFIVGIILMAIVISPAEKISEPVIAEAVPQCTIVREGGLQLGDRFLEVDGRRIFVTSDVGTMLSLNPGETHDLLIERNGQEMELKDYRMETCMVDDREAYGITFAQSEATFGNKLKYTWNSCLNTVRNVWMSLEMLITGKAGLKDMSGPIGIVDVVSDSASQTGNAGDALMVILYFGAFLAINLAVMNMLPIPAVDGGRVFGLLVTTGIEKVTRKKINPKYEGYIHAAGMVLLLILMAVIMFKDIFVIFKG